MLIKNLFYDDTMDCYRPNGGDAYTADIHDMLDTDMDMTMFQQQGGMKQPIPYSPAVSVPHMIHDSYSNGSQDNYSNGSPDNYSNGSHTYPLVDHQMQDYGPKYPPCTLPSKVPAMDTSASNLDWLQPMSGNLQQHTISSSSSMMMDVAASIANADQPVHSQSLTAKILSLPNNVQISGGNVNYVSMQSATQQVYISSTNSPVSTHQQPLPECADNGYRSRSNSASSYVLSPSSAPTSTVSENPFPKPAYSYSCLIALALKNSQNGSLPVAEIYSFMMRHFPYFKTAPDGWKNSVRHNLSLNKCFEKIENPNADGTNSRKGCLWALNPAKIKKMDEEIFKWNKKDPLAIKRAMAHPELLDTLSKGQESFPPRNGMKHVTSHSRQIQLRNPLQQSPLHQQLHHQQQSPNLSPNMRVLNNVSSPMIVSTSDANGLSCPPISSQSQSVHCTPAHQLPKHAVNGTGTSAGVYPSTNGQPLCLDSSLSEISIQSGLFEDLPAELLEYQYSYSPTDLMLSPRKTSPPPISPAAQHVNELSSVQNNLPRGTLISLGQN